MLNLAIVQNSRSEAKEILNDKIASNMFVSFTFKNYIKARGQTFIAHLYK